MSWFLQGIIFGSTISFLLGPLFFAFIETGIKYGLKKGFFFALGTWTSDLMLFTCCVYLSNSIQVQIEKSKFLGILGIIGSLFLFILGLKGIIKYKQIKLNLDITKTTNEDSTFNLFLKGFVINTLNPTAFFIWLGVSAYILQHFPIGKSIDRNAFLYILGIQSSIIFFDLIKLTIGQKFNSWLNNFFISKLQMFISLLFLIFSVILCIKSLNLL